MSWITEEFISIALGDKRLNDRMIKISEKLSQKSTESIPSACGSWAETKAAYRFFENAKVTPDKILKPHIKATQARIKQHKAVLMVQDTTIQPKLRTGCWSFAP